MFLSDDDMVECPYNKTHRMLRRRLQTHLHKCRLQYPDVELRKCPFNTTHLIPEPEFAHHATNCPDRKLITQYKYDAPEPKEEEIPKHDPIECDEDWDDTEVNDYNPQKYLENANVIRKPDGANPSERKEFIKKERKRLGDGDDSSDGESNKSDNGIRKSQLPTSLKRGDSTDSRYQGSRSYNSNRTGRSRSPSAPHKLRRDRSRSPGCYRSYRDHSPQLGSSRDSLRRNYNSYQIPYYKGDRGEDSNNIARNDRSDSDTESDPPMPRTPPPPIISYPAPRSYLTSKYSNLSSD